MPIHTEIIIIALMIGIFTIGLILGAITGTQADRQRIRDLEVTNARQEAQIDSTREEKS
jgi:uncharacterized membrane-anchored protein YhcB (DUF1043 family)